MIADRALICRWAERLHDESIVSTDRGYNATLFKKYEPHWLWALIFIVVPLTLTMTSVFGIPIGSAVPFGVAETAPVAAVVVSCTGIAVALCRRRRALIAIAAVGLLISTAGFLLVWFVS
jgi:hypothetical protein